MSNLVFTDDMNQISTLNFINDKSVIIHNDLEIGSTVRIAIKNSNDQTSNYFCYYYPHLINEFGIIRDKKIIVAGYKLYLVDVQGELHWLNEDEIELF